MLESIGKYSQKTLFAFFAYTPLLLCFILPLIFFKLPLHASMYHTAIPTQIVLRAFFMATGWFALLFLMIIFPRISFIKETPRVWSQDKLLLIMVCLTVAGLLYDVLKFFTHIPLSIAQLVLPLSIAPMISTIIGMYMIKKKMGCSRKTLITLIVINMVIIVVYPLCRSIVYDTAFSLVTLAYAYTVIFKDWKKVIFIVLVGMLLIGTSMVLKNYIREIKFLSKNHWVFPTNHNYDPAVLNALNCNDPKVRLTNFTQCRFKALKPSSKYNLLQDDYALFIPNNHINLPNYNFLKYPKYLLNRIVGRLDHLSEFSYVLQMTPSKIPYINGQSYRSLLYMFIPRLMWHNKPLIGSTVFYGHRYHFITDNDHVTDWLIVLPIEGWINGGWFSFVLSAACIGLLLNFLWAFFVGKLESIGNIIFASILVYYAGWESSATIIFGTLIHVLIFYWVLDIFIRYFHNA